MNELALFAGAGGGILGGRLLGWKTVCAVESAPYCRERLIERQDEGRLGPFPIWDDVRTFSKGNPRTKAVVEALAGMGQVIVTAGFPCQPYSAAGKGGGEEDERNLWPDTIRIVREVGPDVAFLENVPRLLRFDYFGHILGDLADAGYDAEWDVVSAAGVGAPHLRRRLWVLAYPGGERRARWEGDEADRQCGDDGGPEAEVLQREKEGMADPKGPGRGDREPVEGQGGYGEVGLRDHAADRGGLGLEGWWSADPADVSSSSGGAAKRQLLQRCGVEPGLGRVAHGMADRVDRIRAVGNGQVPLVAAFAFVRLAAVAGLDLRRLCPGLFGDLAEND